MRVMFPRRESAVLVLTTARCHAVDVNSAIGELVEMSIEVIVRVAGVTG